MEPWLLARARLIRSVLGGDRTTSSSSHPARQTQFSASSIWTVGESRIKSRIFSESARIAKSIHENEIAVSGHENIPVGRVHYLKMGKCEMNSKGKRNRLTQQLDRVPEVSSGHFPWYPECEVPFAVCGNERGWLDSCAPDLWKLVHRGVCTMRSSLQGGTSDQRNLEFKWVKKGAI